MNLFQTKKNKTKLLAKQVNSRGQKGKMEDESRVNIPPPPTHTGIHSRNGVRVQKSDSGLLPVWKVSCTAFHLSGGLLCVRRGPVKLEVNEG